MITTITKKNLKDLTPFETHALLLQYESYKTALSYHPDLDITLIRLGFHNISKTLAFKEFVNMNANEISTKYKNTQIKYIETNYSLDFIVLAFVNGIQINPNIIISILIENNLGISYKALQTKLARYVLKSDADDTSYLKSFTLLNLIKNQIRSSANVYDLVIKVCSQIRHKIFIPINLYTIIKHALYYEKFDPFCFSLNGTSQTLMKQILARFFIQNVENRLQQLTFKLLQNKIKEIKNLYPAMNQEELIKTISYCIGNKSHFLLSSADKEKVINEQKRIINFNYEINKHLPREIAVDPIYIEYARQLSEPEPEPEIVFEPLTEEEIEILYLITQQFDEELETTGEIAPAAYSETYLAEPPISTENNAPNNTAQFLDTEDTEPESLNDEEIKLLYYLTHDDTQECNSFHFFNASHECTREEDYSAKRPRTS